MTEKIILLSLFWTCVSFFALFCFRTKKIEKDNKIKIFFVGVGFFVAYYIREVVYFGKTVASPDESNYLFILYLRALHKFAVISGPGYVHFIELLQRIFGGDFLILVPTVAFIITTFSFLIFYLVYKRELKDISFTSLSTILLVTTTYFVWAIFEGRPQQLGMILFFIASILFHKSFSHTRYLYLFVPLYFLVFYYHILSFYILAAMLFLSCSWKFIKNESILIPGLTFVASTFFFMAIFLSPGSFYSSMAGGMLVLIKNYPLCLLRGKTFFVLTLLVGCAIFLGAIFILRKIDFSKKIVEIAKRKGAVVLVSFGVVFGLVLQYKMISVETSLLYKHSLFVFSLFEVGNAVFGALFLFGFFKMLKNEEDSIFSLYAVSLMVIGVGMAVLSLFLPGGFNNGLIRIINYWTMFAAPVAALALRDIPYKKISAVGLGLFAVLCIIASSKDSIIFNYEGSWGASEYAAAEWACLHKGVIVEDYLVNPAINRSKLYSLETLKKVLSLRSGTLCGSLSSGNISLIAENKVAATYDDGSWAMTDIISDQKSGIIKGNFTPIVSVTTPVDIPVPVSFAATTCSR